MGFSVVKFIGEQRAQINAELARFKRLYKLAKESRNVEAMVFLQSPHRRLAQDGTNDGNLVLTHKNRRLRQ